MSIPDRRGAVQAQAPRFVPEAIPAELMEWPQWVAWRYGDEPRADGKRPKIPVNPRTGRPAKVSDYRTWGTFERAVACCRRLRIDGIGFVLTDSDPFVTLDLDRCIGPGGVLSDLAARVVGRVDSFTDVSPSGSGLHVIARGTLPADGANRGAIELYRSRRYITITGQRWPGTPAGIEERPAELLDLWRECVPEPRRVKAAGPKTTAGGPRPATSALAREDAEVLRRTFRTGGGRFARLHAGQWEGMDYPTQSEADMAFMGYLSRHTSDGSQILRIFLASPLGRLPRSGRVKGPNYLQHSADKAAGDREKPPTVISSLATPNVPHILTVSGVGGGEEKREEPDGPGDTAVGVDWEGAVQRATSDPVDLGGGHHGPALHLLAGVCRELQALRGDGRFFLACRTAAAVVGADARTVRRHLKLLRDRGLLVLLHEHKRSARQANEYRWCGPAAQQQAEAIPAPETQAA